MKRIKQTYPTLLLFLFLFFLCSYTTDEEVSKRLATRVVPTYSGNIIFKQTLTSEDKDIYSIYSKDGKLFIEGNNANSMATGLNYYLKYYCLTTVSWFANDKIVVPQKMPTVGEKITIYAKVKDRFFLNYCTFGYSMNWWGWTEWERLIDWMALNGVNMALATTGQESVWKAVWTDMGLTQQEISAYFTGPSYLAWHRMANIDAWHSPLPDSWIANQEKLQKQIVNREKELKITPILTAFTGHVPIALSRVYPKAKITKLSSKSTNYTSWGGFEPQYGTYYLDARDSLFNVIQTKFLLKQKELYGNSHVFGMDPFNELDPPSWESDYLKGAAQNIFQSVQNVDSSAVWLQMTWLFFHKQKNWSQEKVKAYLTAVPKDKLLLLDYYCDNTEIWKQTESFYGQPFIWCYLGNFGGNTMIAGNVKDVSSKIENTFKNGGSNFQGLGCTLEGLDVNPFMYEFVLEKAWETKIVDTDWIEKLANRHIGFEDKNMQAAWAKLYSNVYLEASLNKATLLNARPSLAGKGRWNNASIKYDNKDLVEAWGLLLNTSKSKSASYEFDVVNVGRQALENYFGKLNSKFLDAYRTGDEKSAKMIGTEMLEILTDVDKLVSTNSYFLMGKWIADARNCGTTPLEKDYYEVDARNILTTWGSKGAPLTDYANRTWAGLVNSYYKERWSIFINDINESLINKTPFDEKITKQKLLDFEWRWVSDKQKFTDKPVGNPREISKEMYLKYSKRILTK